MERMMENDDGDEVTISSGITVKASNHDPLRQPYKTQKTAKMSGVSNIIIPNKNRLSDDGKHVLQQLKELSMPQDLLVTSIKAIRGAREGGNERIIIAVIKAVEDTTKPLEGNTNLIDYLGYKLPLDDLAIIVEHLLKHDDEVEESSAGSISSVTPDEAVTIDSSQSGCGQSDETPRPPSLRKNSLQSSAVKKFMDNVDESETTLLSTSNAICGTDSSSKANGSGENDVSVVNSI